MHLPELVKKKRASLADAYLLAFFLGLFGAHYFYLRRPRWGYLYLCTFGLFGVGWLIDLFRLKYLVSRFNEDTSDQNLAKEKRLDDAYVLWFSGGLLGFHHFYLGNKWIGILYFFTLGFFFIGWIIDAFLMPNHVELANSNSNILENKWTVTCILAISPTGLFGAHHYYLHRYHFGVVYTCTCGIFGLGYIVDWFRFRTLLKRYKRNGGKFSKRYLDDAYLLWFPLGLLGFHHFYLKRRTWGLLYMLTLGFLGVGWLIDLYRMRKLVENCNDEIDEQAHLPRQYNRSMDMATVGSRKQIDFSEPRNPYPYPW